MQKQKKLSYLDKLELASKWMIENYSDGFNRISLSRNVVGVDNGFDRVEAIYSLIRKSKHIVKELFPNPKNIIEIFLNHHVDFYEIENEEVLLFHYVGDSVLIFKNEGNFERFILNQPNATKVNKHQLESIKMKPLS